MPKKIAAWTPETDRILLLAIIATSGSPSLPTIASFTGYSLNSIKWRFHILKKEATSLRDKSQDTGADNKPSSPASKKRANPNSVTSSPIKKRKTSPKRGKRKNAIFRDTSDEEPPTPIFTESEEEEQTPSLRNDGEEDETGTSSIEPVTPTKVRPQRKVKPAPGYYKLLDEGSEPEFEEGEVDESQSE
ncbi:uncharacterized protein DFL_002642 [Arthrobotrys flagrans]|uniref:Myb-like domain-containing protein n=1 Tax=Arthrobotrys flagrans TaxID=97331 RepID=A0A437AC78_ARTFL|nr:hypothetical protein DFL_002642 [Arthrobotrys flagrans]